MIISLQMQLDCMTFVYSYHRYGVSDSCIMGSLLRVRLAEARYNMNPQRQAVMKLCNSATDINIRNKQSMSHMLTFLYCYNCISLLHIF